MPETRTSPPLVADEREMLTAWLDWHRATLGTDSAITEAEGAPDPVG